MRKVEGSKVYHLFYPVVPAVVAAYHADGVAAMPVVSLVSLSDDPPMVGFSSSADHKTYAAVLEAGSFSVCWLDRRFSRAIEVLGSTSGREVADKVRSAGLHHGRGRVLGSPVLKEASAYLECRFVLSQRFGDHRLVVGEVKDAEAVEDFDEYWNFRDYDPMLYNGLRHAFGKLG